MKELVCLFSDNGQTICDPFAGTATTGVACIKTGRKFIGIEKDQKWFDYGCKRLAEALKQTDLFVEVPEPSQVKMEL